MPWAGVNYVEDTLVRGKGQAVGYYQVPDHHGGGAQVRGDSIHPSEVQLGRRDPPYPRIGEVDGPVGPYHHVVRTIQPLPLIAVHHNSDIPIRFQASHPPRGLLTGNQSALGVSGESVGLIGGLQEHGCALSWRPLHSPIIGNVTEEEVPAFLPPYRALGTIVTTAQLLHLLVPRHNPFHVRRDPLNAHYVISMHFSNW